MIRRSIAFLALLSALLAIVGVSLVGVGRPDVERPTAKLADRVLYYVVHHDHGPRFRVSGQDEELRFITHLSVPPGVGYDPRRVFSYGLRFVVRSPEGNELWRKEVFSESRQSKAGIDPEGWRLENTFSIDPGQQFTDDRTLRLSIPANIPSLSELEVTTVGADDRALVRAYRIHPLGPAQRLVAYLGASTRQRAQLFQRFTFLPWLALSDDQQSYAVAARWERISAEGEAGRDYRTETVYFTGFRVPFEDERATAEGLRLSGLRDGALALHGPIEVDLLAVGGCAERFVGASLRVEHLDGAGQTTEYVVSTCPGALSLSLPAGPHTLRLGLWGSEDPLYVHGFTSASDSPEVQAPLDPDLRSISAYRTGAGQPVFTTSLATLGELESRVLSFNVRRIVPESSLVPAMAWRGTVFYEFLKSDGSVVVRGQWSVDGQMPSRFLELVQAPRIEEAWLPSEGIDGRVLVPTGAREVRVWSNDDLVLTVAVFMPAPEDEPLTLLPPYDDFLTAVRWRFAPLARRAWYPLRATNHREFEASSGAVRLVAPVRLEVVDPMLVDHAERPEPADGARTWVSVVPTRFREKQIVLDRREDASAPADNRRVYSPVEPGRDVRIIVDDLERTHVLYVGESSDDVGREVTVTVGQHFLSHRLVSSRGRLTLPIATTGEATLRIDGTAPSTRFFVDRATAGGRSRLVQRTLYKIDSFGLTLSVANDDGEPLYLNGIVYGCSSRPRPVQLDVVLDGGHPPRVYGKPIEHLTMSRKVFELSPTGQTSDLVFLTRRGPSCSELGRIVLALGDDVAPGVHEFEIHATSGEDVWARFFRDTAPSPSTVIRTWTEQSVSTMTTDPWDLDDD